LKKRLVLGKKIAQVAGRTVYEKGHPSNLIMGCTITSGPGTNYHHYPSHSLAGHKRTFSFSDEHRFNHHHPLKKKDLIIIDTLMLMQFNNHNRQKNGNIPSPSKKMEFHRY